MPTFLRRVDRQKLPASSFLSFVQLLTNPPNATREVPPNAPRELVIDLRDPQYIHEQDHVPNPGKKFLDEKEDVSSHPRGQSAHSIRATMVIAVPGLFTSEGRSSTWPPVLKRSPPGMSSFGTDSTMYRSLVLWVMACSSRTRKVSAPARVEHSQPGYLAGKQTSDKNKRQND
jgi:hypothetical protein